MGGFTGLIYQILGYFLSDYESFKFTTALISEIYSTTDRSRMVPGQEPTSLEQANEDMKLCLESKDKYVYSYAESWWISAMIKCCCCFKNTKCYKKRQNRAKRHALAEEHLAKETDFFKFIKLLRVTQFMSKIVLRKYQRQLVPYFKKYQLTELTGDKKKSLISTEQLLGQLGSEASQRVLNLIDDGEEAENLRNRKCELIEAVD